jgi:hypothetical protein
MALAGKSVMFLRKRLVRGFTIRLRRNALTGRGEILGVCPSRSSCAGYACGADCARSDGGKDGMMAEASGGPGGRIFISYRRRDASYPAAWLLDQLTARFGSDRVFMDVDSIEPGDDFAEVIADAVGSCAVLLAVIGDRWLAAADENGQRRLDDPGDFVRLEIEAALARGVRVIPVLMDGARVPSPDRLPAGLAALARRQAAQLSHARFSSDLTSLLNVLDRALAPAARPVRRQMPARTGVASETETAPRGTAATLPTSITCFQDDDTGFLRWREANPSGYFLNTERKPRAAYLMLHRSGCPHFTGSPLHWTKDYIKFCSPGRGNLETWAADTTGGDVTHCRTCFR